MVSAHAINAADPRSIPAGGPLLQVTSPHVSSLSTAHKGVYATKNVSAPLLADANFFLHFILEIGLCAVLSHNRMERSNL